MSSKELIPGLLMSTTLITDLTLTFCLLYMNLLSYVLDKRLLCKVISKTKSILETLTHTMKAIILQF